jgi:hypothetical protein
LKDMPMLAFAAALALAQPNASDLCVLGAMSAADRREIGNVTAAGAAPGDELLGRVAVAVVRCASEAERADRPALARNLTRSVSFIAHADFRDRLRASGVDVGIIDAWFDRQSLEARTTAQMIGDAQAVAEGLIAAGIETSVLLANGRLVGSYLGSRIQLERLARGMSPDFL